MNSRLTASLTPCITALLCLSVRAESPSPTLVGMTIETGRHVITVGANGLPAQIFVKPVEFELPIEHRDRTADHSDVLAAIGRGNMLRAPVSLAATIEGVPVTEEVTLAAVPRMQDGKVVFTSEIKLGHTVVAFNLTIDGAGAISGTASYEGGVVEGLDMVVPLADAIDTVIANNPAADLTHPLSATLGAVPRGTGIVWGNAPDHAVSLDLPEAPGVLHSLFVGTGDRGFSWLSKSEEGWIVDAARSTMLIERAPDGNLTWRIRFVNRPGPIAPRRTVAFALLPHPAGSRPVNHRRLSWMSPPKPGEAVAPRATFTTWRAADPVVALRADAAVILESFTSRAVLEGPAGGDMLSARQNHIHTYPIGWLRYLAGGATGNIVSLRPNAAGLVNAGSNPAIDRTLLGRALLFDMGLDVASLAHLASAVNTIKALQRFGFFADDGLTEFIPYWRSGGIVRYGQEWDPDSAFDAVEDPNAQVYISIYRRPAGEDGKIKSLFVIVNEGNAWVRDTVYVIDPMRAFGGLNILASSDIYGHLDLSMIPPRSDWDPGSIKRSGSRTVRLRSEVAGLNAETMTEALRHGRQGGTLWDIETHGIIKSFAIRDGIESYGPTVFVGANDFRLLVGSAAKE